HFLDSEVPGPIPSTAQVADLVVKVVRELGQPELAVAFADQQIINEDAARFPAAEQTPSNKAGPSLQELAAWVEEAPAAEDLAWKAASSSLRAYALQEILSRDLA